MQDHCVPTKQMRSFPDTTTVVLNVRDIKEIREI